MYVPRHIRSTYVQEYGNTEILGILETAYLTPNRNRHLCFQDYLGTPESCLFPVFKAWEVGEDPPRLGEDARLQETGHDHDKCPSFTAPVCHAVMLSCHGCGSLLEGSTYSVLYSSTSPQPSTFSLFIIYCIRKLTMTTIY
jgi:hypothetical protein